jgi:hypothetical protein
MGQQQTIYLLMDGNLRRGHDGKSDYLTALCQEILKKYY